MATLGKDFKGAAELGQSRARAVVGDARSSLLKAKVETMREGDLARKQAEQAKMVLMERFRTEVEWSRQRAMALENTWVHLLRAHKTSELRGEVEVLAAQHERDCATRDAAIHAMFDDLMAAEEQYRVAQFNHMRQMDRLIELQDVRITDLETAFDGELRQLANDFHTEMANITHQHMIERREVRSLISTITEAEEAKAAEAEHAHVTAREENRNRSTDRIQELSRTLDDRIQELEAAFEQAHVNYLHATDARTESFKALVAENAKAEKRIQRRAEAVERAKAALVSLRNKMAANAREYEEKNESLARERADQAAHVAGLKARLDTFRAQSDGRLQKLSTAVRTARSAMDSHVALASRILQVAERCRQLEGEGDKIWPIPLADVAAGPSEGTIVVGPSTSSKPSGTPLTSGKVGVDTGMGATAWAGASTAASTAIITSGALVPPEYTAARAGFVPRMDGTAGVVGVTAPGRRLSTTATVPGGGEEALRAAVAAMDATAYADVTAASALESKLMRETIESGELDALDAFWRRYNKALLEQLVLERRRAALTAENEQLKSMLQHCMDGTSITPAALTRADGNPLLVVNGRTGINPAMAGAWGGGAAPGPRPTHTVSVDAGLTVRAYALQGGGRVA